MKCTGAAQLSSRRNVGGTVLTSTALGEPFGEEGQQGIFLRDERLFPLVRNGSCKVSGLLMRMKDCCNELAQAR